MESGLCGYDGRFRVAKQRFRTRSTFVGIFGEFLAKFWNVCGRKISGHDIKDAVRVLDNSHRHFAVSGCHRKMLNEFLSATVG